jgi:hypothetical protein
MKTFNFVKPPKMGLCFLRESRTREQNGETTIFIWMVVSGMCTNLCHNLSVLLLLSTGALMAWARWQLFVVLFFDFRHVDVFSRVKMRSHSSSSWPGVMILGSGLYVDLRCSGNRSEQWT